MADHSVLVHNVAHGDIVLSVRGGQLAKPSHDAFARVTAALLSAAAGGDGGGADALLTAAAPGARSVPVGLRLTSALSLSAADLLFRGGGVAPAGSVDVVGVFFPAVSALLAAWLAALAVRAGGAAARQLSLYLLALPAVAADDEHDGGGGGGGAAASTTEHVAGLVARFVGRVAPEVAISTVVSPGEVLQYDKHITFLKASLVPLLDGVRRAAAAAHGEGWKRRFAVCVTLAAGAPARTAALNAAVRAYQPSVLHLASPKAFWFTGAMDSTLAGVALLDWDAAEGTPAAPLADVDDDDVREIAAHMKLHVAAFLRAVRGVADARLTLPPLQPLQPP